MALSLCGCGYVSSERHHPICHWHHSVRVAATPYTDVWGCAHMLHRARQSQGAAAILCSERTPCSCMYPPRPVNIGGCGYSLSLFDVPRHLCPIRLRVQLYSLVAAIFVNFDAWDQILTSLFDHHKTVLILCHYKSMHLSHLNNSLILSYSGRLFACRLVPMA
jgi:hypothetical protein